MRMRVLAALLLMLTSPVLAGQYESGFAPTSADPASLVTPDVAQGGAAVEAFADCVSGPAVSATTGCTGYDYDGDGDVDLADYALAQAEVEAQTCGDGTGWYTDGVEIGYVLADDVVEASGLAMSEQNPDVVWTHNDSGGGNVIYALRTDGTLLGTYRLGTGFLTDAEDIAIGPGPAPGVDYVYVGDIGDNDNVRAAIRVKRVPEPVVDAYQDPVNLTLDNVDTITLVYPTGPDAPGQKDAETLFVDTNGDLYIVTKRNFPNRVYRATFPQSTSAAMTLEWVATLPASTGLNWITGGDCSRDGRWIVVRNDRAVDYANVWHRKPGEDIGAVLESTSCLIALQSEPQGEAIAWEPDGLGFLTVSEAHHMLEPLWYYEHGGVPAN